MHRLLFVDDEPRVLDSIRRQLFSRRAVWDLHFATSGEAALDALKDADFDAIVTDIRMPGMDGATLLEEVRVRYPDMFRIVLSGQCDSEAATRALASAHRYLSKPCDTEELKQTLDQAMELRATMAEPGLQTQFHVSPAPLRRLLGELGSLPSVPRVYSQLTRRLEDPSVSVVELADLVSEDVGLATQVLRMANSAYFGRECSVTGLTDASARLGTRLLHSLVLTAELYGYFELPRSHAGRMEEFQRHSALVARIASSLEPHASWKDDAFSAGLLHDVGKLVLMSRISERYEAIEREAMESGRDLSDVEEEQLGAHHGSIGAYLLGMWGLPDTILEAVHGHHGRSLEIENDLSPSHVVALADRLAHEVTDSAEVRERRNARPITLVNDPRWSSWRKVAEQLALDAAVT